ncbi:MAG TPA: hypothetical protein VEU62_14620 [Bryobacterales bacterium]|nr:hypothetical protein [Bryobacterales bacterium]
MLQLTRAGTVFAGSMEDLEHLRVEFGRQNGMHLRGLLEPGLAQIIRRHLEPDRFLDNRHAGGTELCLADHHTAGLLHFLTNNADLFRIIRQITGCRRIGCFGGRVYRMLPGNDHHSLWHSDALEHILIGLSINLSQEAYSGGAFQLRDRRTGRMVCELPNTGFGDGILFRIAPDLEHRNTPLAGAVAKTAFAGWFQSRPESRFLLGKGDAAGAEPLQAPSGH